MQNIQLTSKLRELQGQLISDVESEQVLSRIQQVLSLKKSGKLSDREAGTEIRKAAWTISEDLRLNGLDLSSGSNQILVEDLPALLKK